MKFRINMVKNWSKLAFFTFSELIFGDKEHQVLKHELL